MLVATEELTVDASIPLNSFDEPVIVVVPVPLAAPKPMVFPVTVKLLPELLNVIPA